MQELRCYAKISEENLINNIKNVKAILPEGCKVIATVKANAYGHSAFDCAKALSGYADAFSVAETEEALELRDAGIKEDIIILGYTSPSRAHELCENSFIQAVASVEHAIALSKSVSQGEIKIHVKIDTGMHRYGFDAERESTIDEIKLISKLPHIKIEGIFTHFAESDNFESDFTHVQLDKFLKITERLKNEGIEPRYVHSANSACVLCRPETHLDAVRPGIILYGLYPSDEVKARYLEAHPDKPFREVMTMCAKVGQIHLVKKGDSIGYSRNFKAERDTLVATVGAGYADGIPRYASNKCRVKINGEYFNIIGNVCMDILMVDVTDKKCDINVGDEVVFWGEGGPSVTEWAKRLGTIEYTLFTGVSARVKRVIEKKK